MSAHDLDVLLERSRSSPFGVSQADLEIILQLRRSTAILAREVERREKEVSRLVRAGVTIESGRQLVESVVPELQTIMAKKRPHLVVISDHRKFLRQMRIKPPAPAKRTKVKFSPKVVP